MLCFTPYKTMFYMLEMTEAASKSCQGQFGLYIGNSPILSPTKKAIHGAFSFQPLGRGESDLGDGNE